MRRWALSRARIARSSASTRPGPLEPPSTAVVVAASVDRVSVGPRHGERRKSVVKTVLDATIRMNYGLSP
jgi:hypothetical protein